MEYKITNIRLKSLRNDPTFTTKNQVAVPALNANLTN